MVIAVYPEGVGVRDARGAKYGHFSLFNNAAGDPNPSFSFEKFQLRSTAVRGEGIPVTSMQLGYQSYDKGKPFVLRFETVGAFNRDVQAETSEMWDRYQDAHLHVKAVFEKLGFTVKSERHRLADQYPCRQLSLTLPEGKMGEWNTQRVLVELSKAGIVPRDLAAEALKDYPKEAARLASTSELQSAYEMVARAHGMNADQLMTLLAANQPKGPAPAAK